MTEFSHSGIPEQRDRIDPSTLPPADSVATVIVALGSDPGAERLAAVLLLAWYLRAEPDEPTFESTLTDRLRSAATEPGVRQVHVCVVAGVIDDEAAAVWALTRVAAVTDAFAADHTAPSCDEIAYRATLITERAFTLPGATTRPVTAQAALAGARRALLALQPRLRWRLIDIEPGIALIDLVTEMAVPDAFSCNEILLRSGQRWAPTTVRSPAGPRVPGGNG
ncbi:hypothetical protein [Nocardia sp. NBC_00511]|uniref:hypothetical protein n=1 Tax=Nocardia sp. NBC_00511 TaxID=2903591 RepID=UPI0030E27A49